MGICGRNQGQPPPAAPLFTPAQIVGIVIGAAVGIMGSAALAHRLTTARIYKRGDALQEEMAKPNKPQPVCFHTEIAVIVGGGRRLQKGKPVHSGVAWEATPIKALHGTHTSFHTFHSRYTWSV